MGQRKPLEIRMITMTPEVRSNPDGTIGMRGYASVFNTPSHGEVVMSTAFNRTLARQDTVHFLLNHEGTPLASTGSGTMKLSVDDHGLLVDVHSFDLGNPRAQEYVSALKRGDMTQMSFAFTANDAPVVDGVRQILDATLFDVSAVNQGWYPTTSMELNESRRLAEVRSLVAKLPPSEQRDLIIISIDGDVEIEDSTLTDTSSDSSSETETESEQDPATDMAPRSYTVAEARALLLASAA